MKTLKLISEEARRDALYSEDNSEIRYLPYPSMTGIELLGDMMLIEFLQEPYIVILITNKSVVSDHKRLFEFLWKVAVK